MILQKASRKKSKLRLNISGPAGSGKTYSALLMAKGLIGDWDKIAVIDTENGSAGLYSHLGGFNAIDLAAPFSPERYIEAIDACLKAGMECIIIDSSTHEWNGAGGCIDINEKLAQSKYKGNTWSAWSQTTPRHDAFVNKVLQCPVHVITCTRSKMETVMTDDKKVKKLGMKDIQREGWEYELTVSLNIDRDTHTATASKDRTNLFEGKDPSSSPRTQAAKSPHGANWVSKRLRSISSCRNPSPYPTSPPCGHRYPLPTARNTRRLRTPGKRS